MDRLELTHILNAIFLSDTHHLTSVFL